MISFNYKAFGKNNIYETLKNNIIYSVPMFESIMKYVICIFKLTIPIEETETKTSL